MDILMYLNLIAYKWKLQCDVTQTIVLRDITYSNFAKVGIKRPRDISGQSLNT